MSHQHKDFSLASGAYAAIEISLGEDISSASDVVWILTRWSGEAPIIRKDLASSGVSINGDGETITIKINGEDTADLVGHYTHEVWLQDVVELAWAKVLVGAVHLQPSSRGA